MAPAQESAGGIDEPSDDEAFALDLDLVLPVELEGCGEAEHDLQQLTDKVSEFALEFWNPVAQGAGVLDVRYSVSIADPHLPDTPLVAVSKGFTDLTGWRPCELLGKNCRFMNRGCEIDPDMMAGLRTATRTGERFLAVLQNRKKDGTLFDNMFEVQGFGIGRAAGGGERTLLLGLQADVTGFSAEEVRDGHAKRMRQVASLMCEQLNGAVLERTYAGCLEDLVECYQRPRFIESR